MGRFKFISLVLFSFRLLFFTSNLTATSSTQLMSDPIQDGICKLVFCGKGTCEVSPSNSSAFNCNCEPGWKKFDINISFALLPAPCVLPNCTVNFQCGNGSPPPPPPPLPPSSLFPLPDFSDPCLIDLCGDGSCERNGSEFKCQCYEGSANLLKNPKFPCFKKCSLGADCNGLDIGFGQAPPPPPPPPANSSSPGTGDMLNGSGKLHMLTTIVIVLATIFLR